MRFKGLDLNLLVVLDVLLQERNVSRAALRLGLSQPAASAALARLRTFFKDELLVQHGKKMFSTPFADGLLVQLREFLRNAEHLIGTSSIFDPATSTRRFRVIGSDYVVVAVVAPLIRRVAAVAPRVSFELVNPDQLSRAELQSGNADLLITPSDFTGGDQATELLFEERFVVAGGVSNSLFAAPITEEALLARDHVSVQLGSAQQRTFGDAQFDELGKVRRIKVIAASFTTVPWLLVDTELIAVMHERLAREMARKFAIRYAPLPFDFPLMRETMQYHRARATDEGLLWLRRQMHEQAAMDIIGGPCRPPPAA